MKSVLPGMFVASLQVQCRREFAVVIVHTFKSPTRLRPGKLNSQFIVTGHYSDFILATVCNTGTTNHKLQETGNHKLTKPQTRQACKLLTRQDVDRPAMAARDIK